MIMILLIGLGMLAVSIYFLAECVTSEELYDICWYAAKAVLAFMASVVCVSNIMGG